jgi:hypothetical protein
MLGSNQRIIRVAFFLFLLDGSHSSRGVDLLQATEVSKLRKERHA